MKRYWLLGSLLSLSLYAADEDAPSEVVDAPVEDASATEEMKIDETPPPPEVVEAQLRDAQAEFDEAKKMFNPWYAGPLLTPGAHILPPGNVNVQPYLFYTSNYGRFDKHGHSHKISKLRTINPQLPLLFGVLPWMHLSFNAQGVWNKQSGHSSGYWGDTSLGLGFGLLTEKPYRPAVLFGIKESFPTGRYKHLNRKKNGVDATGSGAYQTTFSLNTSKVVWWVTLHPMNIRLSLNYTLPSRALVKGFNAYGGGKGTHGKVHLGNTFQADFGYEYSFTQRWVAALDVVYSYSSKTTFSGRRGFSSPGVRANVGGPFNDQLSLAPALEYNPNPNLSFLAGVWFTVWGRNSLNFVSGVVSASYTF
jgi:hypothetical protein